MKYLQNDVHLLFQYSPFKESDAEAQHNPDRLVTDTKTIFLWQ